MSDSQNIDDMSEEIGEKATDPSRRNIDDMPEEIGEKTTDPSRRSFLIKIAYVAPVIETFLLDEAEAGSKKEKKSKVSSPAGDDDDD